MISMITAVLSAICNVGQSVFVKLSTEKSEKNILQFNALKAGTALILFFMISLYHFQMHLPTMLYGALYGLALLASMVSGYLALGKGPMALTSIITSYSLIIPCVFGAVYLNEEIRALQYLGLILLFASMGLISRIENKLIFQKNWLFYVIITFVCNGVCPVIQKLHQVHYPEKFRQEFMVYALFVIVILLLLISAGKGKKQKKTEIKYAALSGICMGLGSYITLLLSSSVNATVLFPIVSVATMLLNYIISMILFQERFNKIQSGGFIIGIISIVLIKL